MLDLLKNCGEIIIIILQKMKKEFLIPEVIKLQGKYLFKWSNVWIEE